MTKTTKINADKNIGKVLIIVEGLSDEFYILHKIFTRIFDFQFEKFDRMLKYRKYNEKEGIQSSVFVVNSKESAISFIEDSDAYLDSIFEMLIEEYQFPVDRAAIFYVFDRDVDSNTDTLLIQKLIESLSSSREDNGFNRQGLLLLSFPSVESFIASNFIDNSFELSFRTGKELKQYLNECKVNQSNITAASIKKATMEMENALAELGINHYNLDDFSETNLLVFNFQENNYVKTRKYKVISLVCIILLDLGLIEIVSTEE
ncbi:hypothetical protein [Paenibacillus sp. KS-LC4]|uniref:hypothetical protein n=1 Tax=Paenibacillus sp. KS-LC4 TaxID=2979727 RepID=UPI0030D1BE45